MHANPHDGRYAPSPTGDLHLGNLRTALAAWLIARAADARFVLRIDDLDPDRLRPGSAERQLADLTALGLDWDGEAVVQSSRREQHEAALTLLEQQGLTYPCFCSRAEIRAAASAPHGAGAEGAYPGTCARLSSEETRRRVAAGEAHCTRVRAEAVTVGFTDGILGWIDGIVDDFVVRRKDGVPAYNLGTVVDDSDQGVHEVVRGSDLAETTPRQIWLAQRLGRAVPHFAHVPIVVGADGARLGKRHGSITRGELAARGIDAAEVRTLLADSLGMPPVPGRRESARDLLPRFDLAHIPRAQQCIDPDLLVPGASWAALQPL
jgi:glutamyl-tRNA synthetase